MKEVAFSIISDLSDPADKINRLREYLQAMILRSFHESEAFTCLSFVGGTALRFIHNLPRFSEDLDFALENQSNYKPEVWMKKLKNDLQLAGFDTSVSWNNQTTVHKSWVKVAGILEEAGLSTMPGQKLSIKLEIDTNPPDGAISKTGIISRHALLALRYYDLHSLMAGKIHALITRKYVKGRDWYDLIWYRAKRPPVEPNMDLLQNALDQTQGPAAFRAEEWKSYLRLRISSMDFSLVIKDVENFLERPEDAALMTESIMLSILTS